MEYIIIKLLLSSEYYSKYFQYLDMSFYKDNNRDVYKVLLCVHLLQERDLRDYSVEELEVFFHTQYPHLKPDDRVLQDALFRRVASASYDEILAAEYFEKQRHQSEAAKIALVALDVAQGKKDWDTVIEAVSKVGEIKPIEEAEEFVTDDLEELYNAQVANQGLRWRLDTLNKILGSLRKGDFGFVFARPEVGKTTFLASEVTYMAGQADGPILWCNNEEQGSKVNLRAYQAALGVTREELFSDIEANRERFFAETKRNIKIYDNAGMSRRDVERVCKQLNPVMIILDQIDKIYGFESERHDLKMKAIYQWARELSKTYGPVVGICQAGGTGEGKKYLDMNDVDSSHTAKQGEADFILGIGATNKEGEEYVRYLHACKNKLEGDLDTIPELRHGKVQVLIRPELARYEDSMKWS